VVWGCFLVVVFVGFSSFVVAKSLILPLGSDYLSAFVVR